MAESGDFNRLALMTALVIVSALACLVLLYLYLRAQSRDRERELLFRQLLAGQGKMDFVWVDLNRQTLTCPTQFSALTPALRRPALREIPLSQTSEYFGLDFSAHIEKVFERLLRAQETALEDELVLPVADGSSLYLRQVSRFSGPGRFWTSFLDVTAERVRDLEVERTRGRDGLTGLFERRVFADSLRELLQENDGCLSLLAIFNLHGFKNINLQFGFEIGDELLRHVAHILGRLSGPKTQIFRLSADEFAFLQAGLPDGDALAAVAAELRALNFSLPMPEGVLHVSHAAGYAVYPEDSELPESLVECAIFALSMAHNDIRQTRFIRFDKSTYHSHLNIRLRMEEYDAVLSERDFHTLYQPVVYLDSLAVYGFEALSRVDSFAYTNIEQLLEVSRLRDDVFHLNLELIERALEVELDPRYRLFLNLDFGHLKSSEQFWDSASPLLEPEWLSRVVLEITERFNIQDPELLSQLLSQLKGYGALVAIDDYGAGYSNEMSLVHFQPDIVKIDRSIIENINNEVYKQHFVQQFVAFANLTGTLVLAEGVETEGEFETLKAMGVDLGQGYFFCHPKPMDELKRSLNGFLEVDM